MSQQSESVTQANSLVKSIYENMYLDSETADVRFDFWFNNKNLGQVAAHKDVLSKGSEVFKAQFYGPLKEKGDIRIEDATPEAFKEFLQFFYKSNVALTSKNIIEVAHLCKKHGLDAELKSCETSMKTLLSINDMCAGYKAATFLELDMATYFCEQQIKSKAKEICSSTSFLECDQKLFGKVLELLVGSECNALVIVNACMTWAKTECSHKDLGATPANLKAQIKDFINLIPFDKLTSDEFNQFTTTYDDFFDTTDLKAIIVKLKAEVLTQKQTNVGCRHCRYNV